MNIRNHLAQSYNAINELMVLIDPTLSNSVVTDKLYNKTAIKSRLTQKIVELLLNSFLRLGIKDSELRIDTMFADARNIKCNGLKINIKKKHIRPTISLVARSIGEFVVRWLYILLKVVSTILQKKSFLSGPATLLYGVGVECLNVHGSDNQFVEFCRLGPILPLVKAKRIIVQSACKINSADPEHFEYDRFPLLPLLRGCSISFKSLLHFLKDHIVSAIYFIHSAVRNPILSILSRDFAFYALVNMLNNCQLIENVILTNSNYPQQYLWMTDLPKKRFQTHMVWYSMNNNSFVYTAEPIISIYPSFKHIRVDESWVWTEGQARFLTDVGASGVMHVVGPILWYLPQKVESCHKSDLCITVFDVTPMSSENVREMGLAYYYKSDNVIQFVKDILKTCEIIEHRNHTKIKIKLKHKRTYHPKHDPAYIKFIQGLDSSDLTLVPPGTNMYDLISGSDFAIVIPYSSPAYVACHLGIPALYYDPTKELLPAYEKNPLLYFASGRDELIKYITQILAQKTRGHFEDSILTS